MARRSYQQGVKEKTISSLVKGLLYIGSPQFQNASKVSMELEVHQRVVRLALHMRVLSSQDDTKNKKRPGFLLPGFSYTPSLWKTHFVEISGWEIIGPSHSDSKKDGKWEKNENETELNDDPNMAKLSHSVFIWKSMYFGKTHLCSTFRKSLLKEKQSLWLKFEACLLGRDEIYHCEDMCKGTCEDTRKDYISCFSQEPC